MYCDFQPVMSIQNRHHVLYHEVLLRRSDRKTEYDSPLEYLQKIHNRKLSAHIAQALFWRSCKIFSSSSESFALNLPIEALLDRHTFNTIESMIRNTRIGEKVVFEIIGNVWNRRADVVEPLIYRLKDLGVRFAFDGFVTEAQIIQTIQRLQVDIVKLDGFLFHDWVDQRWAGQIVETIVTHADQNRLVTVAKEIETEHALMQAYDWGIDWAQGVFLKRPFAEDRLL